MLKKARVRNFQKHKDLTVKFGPRVTTVVGATEAGKSTFLRALLFTFFSKWKPAYHRHGTSTATAEVWIDGHHVVRRKGKGTNSYTLDGKKLSAVGKGGVPEEVARLFGVTPANVQSQLDPPFWFMETPGAVSKRLNRIVNLELIDTTLAAANAGVRAAEGSVKVHKESLRDAQAKLKELDWVDEFQAAAGRVVRLGRKAAILAETSRRLEIPLRAGQTALKAKKRLEGAVLRSSDVVRAGRELQTAGAVRERLEFDLSAARQAKTDSALTVPDIGPLLEIRKRADLAAEVRRELEYQLKDAEETGQEIDSLHSQLEIFQDVLKDELKKRKNLCPKCGQTLPS